MSDFSHPWGALVGFVACAAHLAVAWLALVRVGRNPLALPLMLLALDLFTWNLAAASYALSGDLPWRWLEAASDPLATPLVLHFVLVYVGARRTFGWLLWSCYAAMGALAAASASAFFTDWGRSFVGSSLWAAIHLSLMALFLVPGTALLLRYERRARGTAEQGITRWLLLALALAIPAAAMELTSDVLPTLPRLANVGTLFSSGVMAMVTLRYRLLDTEPDWAPAVRAVAVAVVAVAAYVLITRYLQGSWAVVVVTISVVTLGLMAATRQLAGSWQLRRQRLENLATMGRFSSQMAHDLKNPLAALKGAAQFLKEEVDRRRPLESQAAMLSLLLQQTERLEAIIGEYQRLGRVEPELARLDLNAWTQETLALQHFAVGPKVQLSSALAPGLPRVRGDGALLARALENLVRNASEAMPQGGRLTVSTRQAVGGRVELTVADTGVGMNARTRERALDDFFTTKASGSGLGLALVKRVAEAHGAAVMVESQEGKGTRVTLSLPTA